MSLSRIHNGSIESNTITVNHITDNTVTSAKLTTTGVVANSYGNSTAIPVLTLDAAGRITNATTSSVSGVTGLSFESSNNTLTVATSITNYSANIQAGLVQAFTNAVSVANTTSYNQAANAYANAISYADTAVSNLVNAAPSALNTLIELANALGNDASFSTTVTTGIGNAYTNAYNQAVSLSNTAYSNATSYAASIANTAYSNATSYAATIAGTAYSNAVSFAANASNISSGTLSNSRLNSVAQTTTFRVTSTQANGNFGPTTMSWNGSDYPTLYSEASDRWIMHINPHICYANNGVNGYNGTTYGAMIRFGANPTYTTYWDAGVLSSIGSDTWGTSRAGTWKFYTNSSGDFYTSSSVRSPIFYDSDNTSYYTNPAGHNSLYNLTVGNSYAVGGQALPGIIISGHIGYDYNFLDGSWGSVIKAGYLANCLNNWEFAIHDSGERVVSPFYFIGGSGSNYILMGRDIGWGTTFIQAASSFRAPIFYDASDSGYYCDPNGTSRFGGGGNSDVIQMVNASYGAWLMIGGWTTDSSYARIRVSDGNLHMDSQNGHDMYLNWYSSGNIQTNRSFYAGAYYYQSDRKLKRDIIPLSTSLINKLKPVNFTWIKDGKSDTGFIAQDVEEVIPHAASINRVGIEGEEDTIYTLNDTVILAHAVKAIQELRAEVDILKGIINDTK